MEPQEKKNDFIRMRAAGLSYRVIAGKLNISKSTCCKWEQELKDAVAELKQEQLNDLYTAYAMTKAARIRKLGETLKNVDAALENADLSEVAPEKLLDYKLKYTAALKEEYQGGRVAAKLNSTSEPAEIRDALGDLLNRVQTGEVNTEQTNRELAVISSLLKAYETTELKDKLEALENIIGGR